MKLHGISNCSTVKKSRDWLAQHGIAVGFHDFKKLGLDAATAQAWLQQTGWTRLSNRSGLPDRRKQGIQDAAAAFALMLEKTSMIKRPLLEQNGKLLHVGYDAAAYSKIFDSRS